MRDDAGKPTSDPERFARLMEGLKTHCPGMIIQLSTGGRPGSGQARSWMLALRPDMAPLSVGSNNFPTRAYENPPDLVDWLAGETRTYGVKPKIEAFDLSHIVQAARMAADGRLKGPLYGQFVMGLRSARVGMPGRGSKTMCGWTATGLRRRTRLWCSAQSAFARRRTDWLLPGSKPAPSLN